jgi:hypothetical protein
MPTETFEWLLYMYEILWLESRAEWSRVVYTLDIETMRQVMQKYKKTGHLHADLPSGVPGMRDFCRVEIALEAGKIVSCSIVSNRGLLITGDKAYQELTRLGRIGWTFVPPSSSPIKQAMPDLHPLEEEGVLRPRRVAEVGQWQMRTWPHLHKLVYGLADGTKSVVEIAMQLSTQPEAINEVLRDLISINVITME